MRAPFGSFCVGLCVSVLAACGSSASGGAQSDASIDGAADGGVDGATDAASPSDGSSVVDGGASGPVVTYGPTYDGGQFHLGPVDWSESQFHNACAPGGGYDARVQSAEGNLLAGLWGQLPNVADNCDACIFVTTAKGKSALLRVVTYGDTTANSIDVSPDAYAILDSGEYPRAMSWQLAKCPDTGAMMYEFQSGSSEWWTSLWVRNARVPIAKVEVKSANHASFVELARGGDGTLTDASGFGNGPFTIRSTGVDGQQVTEDFAWPPSGVGGLFVVGKTNFQ